MSGKSKEEIAFDLVSKLKGVGVWGEQNMQEILDMYAECLEATSGLRTVDGKQSSAVRLANAGSSASKAPSKAPIAPPAPAARPQAAAPVQQPQVRQQQQMVQQAYQQQVPQTR